MEREKHKEILIIIQHWRLYVSHTSHSTTRNTPLLPNLACNDQPRHALWLILVHQLRPSVMLKNTPTRELLFRSSWAFSQLPSLISIDDVFCLLPSDPLDKTWGEKKKTGNMRIKTRKWKKKKKCFSAFFWRRSESKKSEKKHLLNKKKVKGRNLEKLVFWTLGRVISKNEKEKRRETAWCNGCPTAEINDTWLHTDLTRSTTSRRTAMVKRLFNRARDPQRFVSFRNKVFSKKKSEEDSNDSFWTKLPSLFFFVQSFHPSKKKFKKESPNTNKYIFSRDFFKKKTPENRTEKEEKREKHNKRKKNKRTTEKWKRVRSEKKR